jgi:hypothetical protein
LKFCAAHVATERERRLRAQRPGFWILAGGQKSKGPNAGVTATALLTSNPTYRSIVSEANKDSGRWDLEVIEKNVQNKFLGP